MQQSYHTFEEEKILEGDSEMQTSILFNILFVIILLVTECFAAGGSCSICNVMAGLKPGLKRPGELPQVEPPSQSNITIT